MSKLSRKKEMKKVEESSYLIIIRAGKRALVSLQTQGRLAQGRTHDGIQHPHQQAPQERSRE
jgi:hypothetical protein